MTMSEDGGLDFNCLDSPWIAMVYVCNAVTFVSAPLVFAFSSEPARSKDARCNDPSAVIVS